MPELVLLFLTAGAILLMGIAASYAYEVRNPRRRTMAYAMARGLAADPAEMKLTFESWVLDRPDGAQLPVWEITAGGGRDAPIIIMLHGWGESRIDSLARITPFIPFASRIIVYDLRGHGEAEGSRSRLGDQEEDDLLALIDRLGPHRVILFGHSLGATIAIFAAAKLALDVNQPERLIAVLATAPYRLVHTPIRGRLHLLHLPGRPVTDLTMLLLRLRGVRQRDTALAARDVPVPVVIAHGSADTIAPRDDGRAIVAAAPKGEIIVVDAADHLTVLDGEYTLARLAERMVELINP